MKRYFLAAYLIGLHAVTAWLVYAFVIYPPTGWFDKMQAVLSRVDETTPPGSVILLGDSHVQSVAATALDPRAVDFGIGGQQSSQLLAFLPKLKSVKQASAIILLIGTNDYRAGVQQQFPANMAAIFAALPPVPLVVTGLPPLPDNDPAVANRAIQALCMARPRCTYITPPTSMAPDGLHWSAAGYAEWITAVRRALRQQG